MIGHHQLNHGLARVPNLVRLRIDLHAFRTRQHARSPEHTPTSLDQANAAHTNRRFILLMMGELLVNFCLFTFPSMLGGMLGVRFAAKK